MVFGLVVDGNVLLVGIGMGDGGQDNRFIVLAPSHGTMYYALFRW